MLVALRGANKPTRIVHQAVSEIDAVDYSSDVDVLA